MNLKGEYELVVNVELPDGTYTPMKNMVHFSLYSNYQAHEKLNQHQSIKYFDASDYGCLETEVGYHWIRNYFIRVGYVDAAHDEILDRTSLIIDLYNFRDLAREYSDNKEKYIRDVKIDMLDK